MGLLRAGTVRRTDKAGTSEEYIELVGSPDLVVEIVSDASVRKDKPLLRDAYGRAGVAEYWLIDARGHDVEFEILVNAHGQLSAPGGHIGPQESHVLVGHWTLTRTTSRAGHFAYRLIHSE